MAKTKQKAGAAPSVQSNWSWKFATVMAIFSAAVMAWFGVFDQEQSITSPGNTYMVDNVKVFAVENFLPEDLALEIQDAMYQTWTLPDRETRSDGWLYTSNNNGDDGGSNAKTRGNFNIQKRKELAVAIADENRFSYSKWELPPDYDIVQRIRDHMVKPSTVERVNKIFGVNGRVNASISDLFVTQYSGGDFLSPHDDSFAGTYAFVVSLTRGPEWKPGYGGELEFFCFKNRVWCQRFPPKFNTALFFKTRDPNGPPHRVLKVGQSAVADGWHRFGFTGWFEDSVLEMDEIAKQQRDLMKGETIR
eukprot:m.16775 g.16775  ORF g.16775 m.16775 type:complete len:305 (-) comp11198_c0_seq1:303-1217(-)